MHVRPTTQGLVGAILFTIITWLLPDPLQLPLLAGLLWMTVGIYLGMALMDGSKQVLPQFLGGIPVLALALASLYVPWLLVAAWLVHPIWDSLHHFGVIKTRIHPATVPFCIVFDWLIAATTAAVVLGLL